MLIDPELGVSRRKWNRTREMDILLIIFAPLPNSLATLERCRKVDETTPKL
jgi:hypothetical protein